MRWLLAVMAVGCSSSPPPPVPEQPTDPQPAVVQADAGPSADDVEKLRLAAFGKVMEETAGLRHDCWAIGAADDFRLGGRLVLAVTLGADGMPSDVQIAEDQTKDDRLLGCLVERYRKHRWPPVFDAGTSVKVPIEFDVPAGQYTVDPTHVIAHELDGGKLLSHVVLTQRNTGNAGVGLTMHELNAGMELGMRKHQAAEIVFVAAGTGLLYDAGGVKRGVELTANTFVYLPADKEHAIRQTGEETLQLLIFDAPGGPEGRFVDGGADTGTTILDAKAIKKIRRPKKMRVANAAKMTRLPIAGGKGWVQLALDSSINGKGAPYGGLIGMSAGVAVPEHDHPGETETLYIYKGAGTMKVAGRDYPVQAPVAVQVPPRVKHAFVATEDVEAVQFYSPGGPEQRFKPAK